MNPHFIAVPSFGAFTTWRLPCGNLQGLGREADRTTDPKVLALRTVDELGAYLLEGSDLAGSEGDADLMGLNFLEVALLLFVRHLVLYLKLIRILHDSNV